MNKTATDLVSKSENWLRQDVFPLWIKNGIDKSNGGFIESLTPEGQPQDVPRRALVQSRQIYSFVTGAKLNSLDKNQAHEIVRNSVSFFSKSYLQTNGSCIHAVTPQGAVHTTDCELYTQAFALFALAQGYEISHDDKSKQEALKLLNYLKTERRAEGGGYTEIKAGKKLYQSNPHMHMFEAALAWLAVDKAPEWRALADELFDLCKNKFIDKKTGILGEHFNEGWTPELNDGKFVFEPGHHYEWSWLMAVYQDLTGVDTKATRHGIYEIADKYGINDKHFAIDEVWSDFTPKKQSSRFWPQSERVKAAVKLGLDVPKEKQASFAKSADEAMTALWKYLAIPVKGVWQDTLLENGEFNKQDPKASSLYHIINAIYEYVNLRGKLNDQ
jgi:N-acyl-D-glucosamine 2-epimerase